MIIPSLKKVTFVNFVFPEGISLQLDSQSPLLIHKCYGTGGKSENCCLPSSAEANQGTLLLMESQYIIFKTSQR